MFGAHSRLLQVSATLPQRRQTCDDVLAPRRVASAAAAVEVNQRASLSFDVDPMKVDRGRVASAAAAVDVNRRASVSFEVESMKVGRGEKVNFLHSSTPHSRPKWKNRRVFVEKDKILYIDDSFLPVKRLLLQLNRHSKVGVPDDLRETTFAPHPFKLQIQGEMGRQHIFVVLALSDERSFEAWKSLLQQVIPEIIDDKSGVQNVRAAGTFFCGTDSGCFRINSHLIGREMTPGSVRG